MVSIQVKAPWVGLSILVVVFAGCVGNSSEQVKAQVGGPAQLTVNDEYGAIRGNVVDDEQRGLADVDVGLRGKSLVTKSDAEGRFQFGELMPGLYTVDVAKLGFSPMAREVEVKAAEVSQVDVMIEPLAVTSASHYEVWPYTVFYECALGTAAWVSACSYPYTAVYYGARDYGGQDLSDYGPVPSDIQKNNFRYNFTVKAGAVAVVSEASWVPASAAATTMQIILSCPKYDPVLDDCLDANSYASANGKSPLRKEWKTEPFIKKPPEWVMSRIYLPFSGAQFAFQQKVDVWNTVWYNAPPPTGWSILSETPPQ